MGAILCVFSSEQYIHQPGIAMTVPDWITEFPAAITVCDLDGIIISMNNRSAEVFEKEDGRALIGSNVLDCHPEPSRTQLADMLRDGTTNAYTIEKKGMKKLLYQAPWYLDGERAGIIEIELPVPMEIPNHIRE